MVERQIRPPAPAPGGRVVWCSTDPMVTTGDGSGPTKVLRDPIAARALLPNRTGSVLALHRGCTFGSLGSDQVGSWGVSGANATTPLTVCSWGSAARPKPIVRPKAGEHGLLFFGAPVSFLRVVDVDFRGVPGADASGVIAAGDASDITLERCDIADFRTGVCTTYTGNRSRWKLRNVALSGAFDPTNDYNGNGAFFSRTHGIELEGCVVFRNGIKPDGKVTHCHGIYNLAADNSTSGFVARDCIFALNGNTGLSARTGGLVEDCLFAGNAIAWNFGASNTPIQGGIDFVARRVVTTESRGIGWGGWLRNTKSGVLEDAIIANAGPGTQGRSFLIGGNDAPESASWKTHPIENLTVRRMTIHAHGNGPEIAGPWPGANETAPMARNLAFEDCDGPAITGAANAAGLVQTGRKFGSTVGVYPNPGRTVAQYDRDILGGPGTLDHFVQEARKRPGALHVSATTVARWIAAGFGRAW